MKNSIKLLTAVLFIGLPCSVAYGVDHSPPDAGRISGGINDFKILPPDKNGVDLDIQQKSAEVTEGGQSIQVDRFRITGETVVSEQELQQVLTTFIGRELNLGQLQQAANKVADYLRKKGYLVAVTYLPEQEVTNGAVEIKVLIGRYGNIRLENYSRIKDGILKNLIGDIKPGDVIEKEKLERTLLILNDVSGVQSQSILTAGQSQGSTDLIVRLFDTQASTVMIGVDNSGNRFTGQERANLSIFFNNASGYGDEITLRGISSGKNLNDFSFSYQLPIGKDGYKAGLKYERLHYRLGEDFAFLDASGRVTTKEVFISYPLQRSSNTDLNIRFAYARKSIVDMYYDGAYSEPKHSSTYTLSMNGRSQYQGNHPSRTNYSVAITRGKLGIENAGVADYDRLTAKIQGHFWKLASAFSKEQYLTKSWHGHLFVNTQLANKNLDSSEDFSLGGMNGIRAYPQGEASGDQGYLVTAELRRDLAGPQRQLVLFVDQGGVVINKRPWVGSGENYRALAGAGLGLIFTNQRDYSLRIDYAWKLSSEKARSDKDKNGRFWLQGVMKL